MKRKYVKVLVIAVIIIFAAILAIRGTLSNVEANLQQLADLKVQNVDLDKIPDGVYKGSYKAFPINVEVKVTVNNHRISGIQLVKHTNGQGAAAEVIPDKVVEAQTLEVDVVSSATYSSKVILKAIENALNSANQ